jgi:hypothetical protein
MLSGVDWLAMRQADMIDGVNPLEKGIEKTVRLVALGPPCFTRRLPS